MSHHHRAAELWPESQLVFFIMHNSKVKYVHLYVHYHDDGAQVVPGGDTPLTLTMALRQSQAATHHSP